MPESIDYSFSHLVTGVAFILGLVFLLTRTKLFRFSILLEKTTITEKIPQILFFGFLGILGTYSGFYIPDGITNTRAIGVIIGGLIGGPLVGTGAGLIAGIHRLGLDSLTMYTSAISAVIEGLLAGLLASTFRTMPIRWPAALLVGFCLETIHMLLLLLSPPFERSAVFVMTIAPYMLFINPLGIATFMAMLDSIRAEQAHIEGNAAFVALKIAEETLHFLRKGLTETSAAVTVQTIMKQVKNLDAVAIRSQEELLAFVAKHPKQTPEPAYGTSISSILKNQEKEIGELIFYKEVPNSSTPFETELIKGLGQLISTQIELSNGEQQAALRAQAEIKALQAQINPHFLFNALNTIAYYCRKEPEEARSLLLSLGEFYRNNLTHLDHFVDIQIELQHVEAYIKIEAARFQGKLNVYYDLPTELRLSVPPLILQPIVENAIRHGLYPKRKGGTIILRYEIHGEQQWVIVEDNGVGMSGELIDASLKSDPNRKSIGLSNVHQRLQAIYGLDYGVIITSEIGEGTRVCIPFPLKGGIENATKSDYCGR
ncbi:MAG: LytS/YhcK type 5TM receptor domain-containing protein [Sporomusaceae bacterium]|nr:LytS/YhcK type 5TM receptor domain-containing protein [Sporomusaceae bacterium]